MVARLTEPHKEHEIKDSEDIVAGLGDVLLGARCGELVASTTQDCI
jgi:hypothetical protein